MKNRIEQEPFLKKKLKAKVEGAGGFCLNLDPAKFIGIPDKLCLLPGGVLFFAEMKTTGKKPRRIQLKRHVQLRALGFRVYVLDNSESISEVMFKELNHVE